MVELTNDNFDDIVGKDKYVFVKFYTKWCMYCKMLAPEYEKLYERYQEKRKDEIVIARLEGGANDIIISRYGVYSFPLLALFFPGDRRIKAVFQGQRTVDTLDQWLDHLAPKLELPQKKEESKKNDSNTTNDNIEEDNKIIQIQNKTNMTDESEYIKREFIDIKKKIGNIEKMISTVNNLIEKEQNLRANISKGKGKITENKNKITIEIDVSPFNIIMGLIVVSVIISVVLTGKKLIYNLKGNAIAQGGAHIKE